MQSFLSHTHTLPTFCFFNDFFLRSYDYYFRRIVVALDALYFFFDFTAPLNYLSDSFVIRSARKKLIYIIRFVLTSPKNVSNFVIGKISWFAIFSHLLASYLVLVVMWCCCSRSKPHLFPAGYAGYEVNFVCIAIVPPTILSLYFFCVCYSHHVLYSRIHYF